MWWYDDLVSIFWNQPWWCDFVCSMMRCIYCLLLLSSLLVWSWGVCSWDTWLNHFGSPISYIWLFPVAWEDWDVLSDMFLMMSYGDTFDLTILSLWSVLWFIIGMLYGCSLENHWILWVIIDAFRCRYGSVVIMVIIIWCLSVAHGELMWLLRIIFIVFSVACIGLKWFGDLWFHEPRVGYLCVVSGSGLQWGSEP